MTIGELNDLGPSAFVEALGWVMEGSPWVAERAWSSRPFRRVDDLHAAFVNAIDEASPDEQLAVLLAHPDLGSGTRMSAASTNEQEGVGLGRLPTGELQRLTALNATYREKFGFPFLCAVKGRSAVEVLNALERRLTEPRDAERSEALRQVCRIARFRLEEIFR